MKKTAIAILAAAAMPCLGATPLLAPAWSNGIAPAWSARGVSAEAARERFVCVVVYCGDRAAACEAEGDRTYGSREEALAARESLFACLEAAGWTRVSGNSYRRGGTTCAAFVQAVRVAGP